MIRARGLCVDHTTVWRWVQCSAPEINKRMRPHLKMSGTSYRIDETYMKVGAQWKYLYRAVDSAGGTIEFMPSAKEIFPRQNASQSRFNNIIEHDHRAIRRRWRAGQCLRSFHTAERAIEGIEALHMMRKGQVKRLDGRDAVGQAMFIASLFRAAA